MRLPGKVDEKIEPSIRALLPNDPFGARGWLQKLTMWTTDRVKTASISVKRHTTASEPGNQLIPARQAFYTMDATASAPVPQILMHPTCTISAIALTEAAMDLRRQRRILERPRA
jgi:hypothetical protein